MQCICRRDYNTESVLSTPADNQKAPCLGRGQVSRGRAVSGIGSLIKVSCCRTGDGREEGSQGPSTTPARWEHTAEMQRQCRREVVSEQIDGVCKDPRLKHFHCHYLSLPSSSTISGGEILESWELVISLTVMGVSGGNWSVKIVLDHNSSQLLCSPKPLFDVTWDNKK